MIERICTITPARPGKTGLLVDKNPAYHRENRLARYDFDAETICEYALECLISRGELNTSASRAYVDLAGAERAEWTHQATVYALMLERDNLDRYWHGR
jgi:hypothetical protein